MSWRSTSTDPGRRLQGKHRHCSLTQAFTECGLPSRRTNGSLPDPGCWRAVRLLNSDSFGTCIPWCNQSNFPPDQPESRFFAVLVASVCAEPSERMEVEQKCVAREVEANVR